MIAVSPQETVEYWRLGIAKQVYYSPIESSMTSPSNPEPPVHAGGAKSVLTRVLRLFATLYAVPAQRSGIWNCEIVQ